MKCTSCKTEITGGCYNTPRGLFCCRCWEQTSKGVKRRMGRDELARVELRRAKEMAEVAKLEFENLLKNKGNGKVFD